jgi:uncharacterized protein YajQ (UPF0234 family)
MAADSSFDIVSKVDLQEARNAVDQAAREIETRFDFKGSSASVELDDKAGIVKMTADSESQMDSVVDVLKTKLHRRSIDIKALDLGDLEEASKGTVRQQAKIRQGLESETTKKIVKIIKDSGLKVQVAIQGDSVRVTGKSRDDLQAVMTKLKATELDAPLQFNNYR